ncbi:NUDIX domain-containing protein [Candidatus Parcubacteria bacterium]|nr:NUDIX domain-containing protein [Candidatus Parcubacteria bacterium]
MPIDDNRTFIYGERRPIVGSVPGEIYPTVQETTSIYCIDVFVLRRRPEMQVLLGRRVNRPAKGFMWPPGGRKFRNELWGEAAARHLKKDTGLEIAPDRFRYLDHVLLLFDDRQQEPIEVGTDTPVTQMGLELTEDEGHLLDTPGELDKLEWCSIRDILDTASKFDRCVQRAVTHLLRL